MSLKRKVFSAYLNFFMRIFKSKKFERTLHINCSVNQLRSNAIDLITIAFNNDYLIENQIKLVKKYLTDASVSHVIADNSTDRNTRKKIYEICEREGVPYLSLPRNPVTHYVRRACYSHGSAMNWMYHNFIRLRQPRYFGFIDHDIFPTEAYSIEKRIKNMDFFGEKRVYGVGWYLWAGFCFFNFEATKNYKLNFFPCIIDKIYLDTGGANFQALYSRYEMKDNCFPPPPRNIKIGEGDEYYIDYIQYIDQTWVHSICAENFNRAKIKKEFMENLFREKL